MAGLSTSADAQPEGAAVGDGATVTRAERSEQFSRAPCQDHTQVPRRPAATRRSGGAQGPTDLGLVRRPPAPCSPTVWALLAAGAVVAAVDFFLPAGSAEVDGAGAHHMAMSRHAVLPARA